MTMHEDEIVVEESTVRELIADQFPQWSHLDVRRLVSSGTVNAIFRLGDTYAARFALRPADPTALRWALEDEARSSLEFQRHCRFPSPTPVAFGAPGPGFAWPWSVQTWVEGTEASRVDVGASDALAVDLAELLASLRAADPGGRAFTGSGRGGDLHDHDQWVDRCIRECAADVGDTTLRRLWSHFRDVPRTSTDVMTHGDLTPANVLVDAERLVGILDCGGFGPADPALDVIVGWHLLDDGPRDVFRATLGCDDLEWERSKAWAFQQALGAYWYYATSNPVMHEMGRRSLERVFANTRV